MMNQIWFIAFLATAVAYHRERRRRRDAEQRAAESAEREKHFGTMLGHILQKNPDTVQAYFDSLIEDDWDEEEQ